MKHTTRFAHLAETKLMVGDVVRRGDIVGINAKHLGGNKVKRQTDLQLIGYLSKYGCFFMCIAYWINWQENKSEPDYDYLNRLWMEAIKRGFISGDMNNDGDMDDANELLLLDKNGLLSLCGIKLKYREAVDVGNFKPRAGSYYIGEFYNPKTRFTHFAVINEKKECVYDPIKGSITVRDGYIKTIRVIS